MPLVPLHRTLALSWMGNNFVVASGMDRNIVIAETVSIVRERPCPLPMDLIVQSMDDASRWRAVAVLVVTERGEEVVEVRSAGVIGGRDQQ